MTPPSEQDVGRIARDWAIRMRDPAFDRWDDLTQWLEGSPSHAAAFDRVADAEDWIEDLYRSAAIADVANVPDEEASDPVARRPLAFVGKSVRSGYALWGSVAAGLLAVTGAWYGLTREQAKVYSTAPGEQRTIALNERTSVALNGDSTLHVESARRVRLESGEANFTVRHDPDDPFTVLVGDDLLVDLGTRFNVVNEKGRLTVGVEEGSVAFQTGDRTAAQLRPGDVLTRIRSDAPVEIRHLEPAIAGSWRRGYLSYVDAPLDDVAADLARYLGRRITVDRAMAGRVFSGSLMLGGPREALLTRAAPLLRARFVAHDGGWVMTAANAGP